MESIPGNRLILTALLFTILSCRLRAEETSIDSSSEAWDSNVPSSKKAELPEAKKGGGSGGGVYGGGGCGWGWGGPGGSSGGGGGGGGSGYWKCQCKHSNKKGKGKHQMGKKRDFISEEYRMREFGECTARGKCRGMRLDCPLSCGGTCVYDCIHTCKAHCKT